MICSSSLSPSHVWTFSLSAPHPVVASACSRLQSVHSLSHSQEASDCCRNVRSECGIHGGIWLSGCPGPVRAHAGPRICVVSVRGSHVIALYVLQRGLGGLSAVSCGQCWLAVAPPCSVAIRSVSSAVGTRPPPTSVAWSRCCGLRPAVLTYVSSQPRSDGVLKSNWCTHLCPADAFQDTHA